MTWTDDQAKEEIGKSYAVETCRRLKVQGRDSEVVMIRFSSRDELEKAIKQELFYENQKFNFEESYGKKQQVIRCFKCQKFGKHIARLCPHEDVCKRCAEKHSDKNCQKEPKCANCSGNHEADNAKCPTFIEYRENRMKPYVQS